ncbi:MAG: hypothetical protein A2359_00210 [Candidatus Moranbacteria bacterium RIFOXYB1_FULL_43_19]|nr:MAG: hypothetical protein A2359_00210 [Candidatus Moranbacteria bacterium RIFOXYB1_FULL_43_19]OGI34099.1 MAG: hypothetical protein A2420_00920 [Candidatus Moranbacteria bacterium RIFOXYC1_FULL_44_13]OGI37809.1 MAG: hypothetical protein A2612_04160 [Candidatus Moranbacteria bacterium RIFOXYD1_FULL_44_12]
MASLLIAEFFYFDGKNPPARLKRLDAVFSLVFCELRAAYGSGKAVRCHFFGCKYYTKPAFLRKKSLDYAAKSPRNGTYPHLGFKSFEK